MHDLFYVHVPLCLSVIFIYSVKIDVAFEAIGCTSATNCPLTVEQLAQVLEYHVVSGAAFLNSRRLWVL